MGYYKYFHLSVALLVVDRCRMAKGSGVSSSVLQVEQVLDESLTKSV